MFNKKMLLFSSILGLLSADTQRERTNPAGDGGDAHSGRMAASGEGSTSQAVVCSISTTSWLVQPRPARTVNVHPRKNVESCREVIIRSRKKLS